MQRRSFLRAGIAVSGAVLLSGAVGALDPVLARPRVSRSLAQGLRVPWGIAFLPSGRALVSERDTGRVLEVRPRGGYRVAGQVPGVVSTVTQGGENGLLGLALHPDFARNRWVYAYLSTASDNRVVRMRYDDGQLGAPEVVLPGIARSLHHDGGALAFGRDGLLYVSTGDAEHPHRAQDPQSLSGKVLRITDAGGVPAGNPFGNQVWSYGARRQLRAAPGRGARRHGRLPRPLRHLASRRVLPERDRDRARARVGRRVARPVVVVGEARCPAPASQGPPLRPPARPDPWRPPRPGRVAVHHHLRPRRPGSPASRRDDHVYRVVI
jgi:hypothetical protein